MNSDRPMVSNRSGAGGGSKAGRWTSGSIDVNVLDKARSVLAELRAGKPPVEQFKARNEQVQLLGRLIGRFVSDAAKLKTAVETQNLDALEMMLNKVAGRPTTQPAGPEEAVSPGEMERALSAFRKRLKLTRLSDESKLGGRYTSGGRASKIDAIEPPFEFPMRVWKALARAGKLKDTGGGFFGEA
jgi:hypothetical protein